MRYALLLLPAIVLDILQALTWFAFFALQFTTPVGGGIIGASTGLAWCWNASSGLWAWLEAAQCAVTGGVLGAAASAFAIPIGTVLDVVLSLTFGSGIIILLIFNGVFNARIVMSRFLGEAIPLLCILPIWTNMVWACIKEKQRAEAGATSGVMGGVLSTATGAMAGGTLVGGMVALAQRRGQRTERDASEARQNVLERIPLVSKRFSDIRPAAKGVVLALLLCVGFTANAQVGTAPIQYVVNPEIPGPNQTVTIEAQGVGSFLGSATITWRQGGATVKTGVGERTFTFTTGALGERTTIQVSIDSSQGSFSKTFTFNPSKVNLIWEANTTVPLLYKGKALYTAGSSYKVIAYPTVYSGASRVAASALSYQWSYNSQAVPEQSGLGRSTFTKAGDQLQVGETISLDIYYGTAQVARGAVYIPATNPFLLLYQRDPLRGVIYDTALPAAISLVDKEITVQAEPFYFAAEAKKAGAMPYAWTLNDAETSGPDSARGIITLRQNGSGTGSADLGVSIQNNTPDQFVQQASAVLKLVFGAQSNSLLNLFGL